MKKLGKKILWNWKKDEVSTNLFFNSFIKLIELGIVFFISLALLQQLKILNLEWMGNILDRLPKINQELNRQFLFSQISVTFMILSLFSLIINLKKKNSRNIHLPNCIC